jgi:prefoldin subunit 5
MANDQVPTARIERNIDSIEREIKEMRHSLKLYMSNPRKYEPQLENLAQAAMNAERSAKVVLRALGVSGD